jgi:hypothetical protein
MSTIWHCNKERERNTHLRVKEASWNIALLLSYLKSGRVPPPRSGVSFWWSVLAFWRLNLAFLHVWESPIPGAIRGGVWLGLPSRGLSPKHKKLVFWLFLLSYMTSGPFSWWYFLLLTQRFFWYYFSRKVMANLCCVAQKAASAAQKWSFLLKSKSDCPAQPRKNGTTQLSARPLALLDVHPCLYQ